MAVGLRGSRAGTCAKRLMTTIVPEPMTRREADGTRHLRTALVICQGVACLGLAARVQAAGVEQAAPGWAWRARMPARGSVTLAQRSDRACQLRWTTNGSRAVAGLRCSPVPSPRSAARIPAVRCARRRGGPGPPQPRAKAAREPLALQGMCDLRTRFGQARPLPRYPTAATAARAASVRICSHAGASLNKP